MKNFKYNGQNVPFTASGADVVSGEVVVKGQFVGVSSHDVADGDDGIMSITGVYELKKQAGLAMAQGDVAYYDTAAKEIDDDNLNTEAGIVYKGAATGADTVLVLLKGGSAAFN